MSRRNLLAGLGAVGGGMVLTGGLAQAAAAEGSAGTSGGAPTGAGTRGTTITSTLASAPQAGVRYEFRNFWDFTPETGTNDSHIQWSTAGGVYNDGGYGLWTSFDLPPGAVIYDVEWYVLNNSGATQNGSNRLWVAGQSFLTTSFGDTSISTGGGLKAVRTPANPAQNGPFPHGCRVACGATGTSSNFLVNGVRIGYKPGALSPVLLTNPVRAYDSRSAGGAMSPNEVRTISLASAIPVGAVGAILSLSLTGCNGNGTVRLGAGGTTPTATAIQWSRTGDQVTTAANTAANAARQIAVKSAFSTGTTHVIVDVVGYLV